LRHNPAGARPEFFLIGFFRRFLGESSSPDTMEHIVKILSIGHVTHDVLRIVAEKPQPFSFKPGQAADIAINKADWRNEKRPFTFTGLPDYNYLEFTIKTYPSRNGVTNELLQLKKDDELIVADVFGAIEYKGPGIFIAGGAGVTPFISIFRDLHAKNEIGDNKLLFANKTKGDIILEQEFRKVLGKNFVSILSDEKAEGMLHGFITEDILKSHGLGTRQHVYVCGPPPMMESIEKQLARLRVDEKLIVKEAI
jgi:ferredoxin-NADP reductase